MKSPTKILLAVLVMLSCLAIGSSRVLAEELSGQLIISGSDTLEPMVQEMAKSFMMLNKGVKITIKGGGSSKGVNDVRGGFANIGMVSRALTSKETGGTRTYTIANDGMCFVTAKKNPVRDLTTDHLLKIFTGKARVWSEVGGNGLPISALIRDRLSSSNKVVAEFLGVRDIDIRGSIINDATEGIRYVASDPEAIFFVSAGEAFHSKMSGGQFNLLSVDGVKPSIKSIANGSYPLTRPLSLITKGEPTPLARVFIDYCNSKVVEPIIQSFYFVVPE